MRGQESKRYLKRLPASYYQAEAYVHWTMAIKDRRTGWLEPKFYYKFRELLTHTLFRYGILSPVYCCMPDHFHLLWVGVFQNSDQRNAMKYLRRQLNENLRLIGVELQSQAYDNVLSDEEREENAFNSICEYIARNPERRQIVAEGEFRSYRYSDCLIPGAPEVHFRDKQFWSTFWRIHSFTRENGFLKAGLSAT